MDRQKARETYQLRQTGELCWLLDMTQPGIPYRQPVPVNEVGAEIWRLCVLEGLSVIGAAQRMSAAYEVPEELVASDIREFAASLAQNGIVLELEAEAEKDEN